MISQFFVRDAKSDGTTKFTRLRDDRPKWLFDAVYAAHQGKLPCDWIFDECKAAAEAFDSGDLDGEDSMHSYADGRVDVYTQALYQWQADFCLSDLFAAASKEAEGMGLSAAGDPEKLAQIIQYSAIARIAQTILDAARENLRSKPNVSRPRRAPRKGPRLRAQK